eukprot:TRINITY_DN2478_c0_g1_i1.p1 TRINITY_DN2478_c0_g1~~TRINITY_DN2478_c0_g1_i1.p1  ORF type:complete len:241 (-),score=84.30 TRINITY_DN2478_c0_g1_i1:41-709(-)
MAKVNLTNFWTHTRKIAAIGRNYSDHAKELGNAVPTSPFFFLKPSTSLLRPGSPIVVPEGMEVHHEVELALIIGRKGKNIQQSQAFDYIAGYSLGIDLTARDLQQKAKEKGLPWSSAKGMDTFCPIGDFIPKERIQDPQNVDLWLKIDGAIKQQGNTNQMIFKIPRLIEHVSNVMTLEEGDIILTGTPSGVGPIKPGQVVEVGLGDIYKMKFDVTSGPAAKL